MIFFCQFSFVNVKHVFIKVTNTIWLALLGESLFCKVWVALNIVIRAFNMFTTNQLIFDPIGALP